MQRRRGKASSCCCFRGRRLWGLLGSEGAVPERLQERLPALAVLLPANTPAGRHEVSLWLGLENPQEIHRLIFCLRFCRFPGVGRRQPCSVRSRESGLLGVELPVCWRDLIAYLRGAEVELEGTDNSSTAVLPPTIRHGLLRGTNRTDFARILSAIDAAAERQ